MDLTALCRELKNYFTKDEDKYLGEYSISGGVLTLSGTAAYDVLQEGQYFRIVGSVFNDGVYQYPVTGLTDETFDGAIWAMKVPKEVFTLLDEINEWQEKYGSSDAAQSPFQSESFGGYAYTKGTVAGLANNKGASPGSWQWQFASRLDKWRKIRE